MPTGYVESEAGRQAYAALGVPYDQTLQDELYAKWVSDTIVDEKELAKWHHKEKEVTNILRLRKDGKEYIQYSFQNWRLDKDLNPDNRFVPQYGKYPIPHADARLW